MDIRLGLSVEEKRRFKLTQSLSKPSTSGNPDKSSPRRNSFDIHTVPPLPESATLKMKNTQISPFVTQPLNVERLWRSSTMVSLRRYRDTYLCCRQYDAPAIAA